MRIKQFRFVQSTLIFRYCFWPLVDSTLFLIEIPGNKFNLVTENFVFAKIVQEPRRIAFSRQRFYV